MRIHFSGIGGAGMNPLAQIMQKRGHQVQGSDRGFDQGQNLVVAELLRDQGISILPQDGSAISDDLDLMIYSAAVEQKTPEMQQAASLGIQRKSRPDLLAEMVNAAKPGIAIAGTSGKSSVVGLVAWIMRCLNLDISVLGGAALAERNVSHMGCCMIAADEFPLIAEACESDGTLIQYQAGIGLVHNITRDHDELDALQKQFSTFVEHSDKYLYNAACPLASGLAKNHANSFSYGTATSDLSLEIVRPGPLRAQANITYEGEECFLDFPQPGEHNLQNVCAALAVCVQLGVDLSEAVFALRSFPGVARRYQIVGTTEDNIRVIDDYAHNADKIRAVVEAAQLSSDRLIIIFQPHGFGPARFLRPELKELLPRILRRQDLFLYAPIFYAGGTVAKDISSEDLARDLMATKQVFSAADKQSVLKWAAEHAMPNDTVLLLGARDPALPDLAQALFALL